MEKFCFIENKFYFCSKKISIITDNTMNYSTNKNISNSGRLYYLDEASPTRGILLTVGAKNMT